MLDAAQRAIDFEEDTPRAPSPRRSPRPGRLAFGAGGEPASALRSALEADRERVSATVCSAPNRTEPRVAPRFSLARRALRSNRAVLLNFYRRFAAEGRKDS